MSRQRWRNLNCGAAYAERTWLRRPQANGEGGRLAIRRSANLEVSHCEHAEAQLLTLRPSIERKRTELEVQLAKGVAIRAGRGYAVPEFERVFLRASELCAELGDQVRLGTLSGVYGASITSPVGGQTRPRSRIGSARSRKDFRIPPRCVLAGTWAGRPCSTEVIPAKALPKGSRKGCASTSKATAKVHIRPDGHRHGHVDPHSLA